MKTKRIFVGSLKQGESIFIEPQKADKNLFNKHIFVLGRLGPGRAIRNEGNK